MGSSKNKSFVGGFPNANLFPFAAMVVKTTDGRTINIEGAKMKRALQYLPTAGLPELVTWMKNLQVQQEKKCFCVFHQEFRNLTMGNDHLIEFHLTESVDRIFRSNA